MLPVGWKKTGVQAPSDRARRRMAAAWRMSEIELEGEHAARELPAGFAPALEVETERAVAPEGEALLHAERARPVFFAEEVIDAARVGVHAPARCRIEQRAETTPAACGVPVLEVVMRSDCAFGEGIHQRAFAVR